MPDSRPKVFVANRSAHDYSSAKKYGELVFVTSGRQDRFAANNHARMWMDALKDSSPQDFIILSSMNIICGIGCALFAMMHGRVNLLMYRRGKYIRRELMLDDMLLAEEIVPGWASEWFEEEEDA